MKKRFLKFFCAILLSSSFLFAGCVPMGDPGAIEGPSGDLTSTAENANDIIKTKDNITYYYEDLLTLQSESGLDAIDREKMVVSCFTDAYLFIDPGYEQEFTDHFSKVNYPFYQLVDRQIDVLAQTLSEMIDRIYISDYIAVEGEGAEIINNAQLSARATIPGTSLQYKGDYITTTPLEENSSSLFLINDLSTIALNSIDSNGDGVGESVDIFADVFDLNNITTIGVMANAVANDEGSLGADAIAKMINFKIDTITASTVDGTATQEVVIDSYMFDFAKAIFGGKKHDIATFTPPVLEGQEPIEFKYVDFLDDGTDATLNKDSEWEFLSNYGHSYTSDLADLKLSLKEELKYRIASAVSGMTAEGTYSDNKDKYEEMLAAIDHIGFTEQDQLNIKKEILDNLIGTALVEKDNSYIAEINEYFNFPEESLKIEANPTNFEKMADLFVATFDTNGELEADSIHEFQNYKAYDTVIEAFVKQATNLTGTYMKGDTAVVETILPSFPRIQLIVIDARLLMDAVGYEEENGESDDHEDIEADEIPTETEGMELTEKLSQFVNLKSIMFLPRNVIGERTMAVKENGEWVEDEDHEQVLKTFNVEGFLLSNIDVVLLTDNGNTAVIQANYTLKTKNKEIKKQSEAFGVGYEKPDPTVEETYSSTDILDIEKQKIIESEEDVLGPYRIFGYNGLSIDENGIVSQKVTVGEGEEVVVPITVATKSTLGLYNVFTFGTDMYEYLTIDSVVGGTAGYSLNINNFAGENYVLADFSVMEVNNNQENRKVDLNILYLSCETT